MDKSKFKDEKGRYIVQGLFLEDQYNKDMAVFTFNGEDKMYKGKKFISLKKRYLEKGDPEEYLFAEENLFDWPHWQRLCRNAIISRHIDDWREELNISLRAEGVATIIDLAINEKSYQAAKWLADEGWIKKERGRPSKEEVQGEVKRRAIMEEKFSGDLALLEEYRKKKSG